MENAPRITLVRNPWSSLVRDGVLLQLLQTAAIDAWQQMQNWNRDADEADRRESFAAVLLDPTKPRWAILPEDLVMAIILIGPNAENLLPNGLAKADGHDRHGLNMGVIVKERSHLLADGEFAWGMSAEYLGAIGGGSGLKDFRDGELVLGMLETFVEGVRHYRDTFIAEQRADGSHGWYNVDNAPGEDYADVILLTRRAGVITIDLADAA